MHPAKFDMKHLKKAEEWISWNVMSITMKMKTVVQIKIIKFHLRNLDKPLCII